jgi:ABC-type transport system involved in multi-copper enzyme maturation permease subunit
MRNTWILFKDELLGFAKSWAMIALWVGMPLFGILLYFTIDIEKRLPSGMGNIQLSAPFVIGFIVAGIASTLAAILVSVEIVNEKNRKVYDLYFIRPIHRGHLMWAKFFAVVVCVTIALAISLFAGVLVDVFRGNPPSPMVIEGLLDSFMVNVSLIAISAAMGILTGVIAKTVVVAVVIVWFLGQYVMMIPVLPSYLGIPEYNGLSTAITLVLVVVFMSLSSLSIRRMEY